MSKNQKKKVYVYLMGKIQQNNSIVRAIEVELDTDNTVKDVVNFLFGEAKIKTKDVWVSLRQNGTKLNECVTVKDMQSIVEDNGSQQVLLFLYNNDNVKGSNTTIKSHRNQPIVFETIPDNNEKVQEMEQIKLATSAKSVRLVPTQQSFLNERFETENNLTADTRPRRISKKQSIKEKSKNQCCLLM